jgi:hypothetical protein
MPVKRKIPIPPRQPLRHRARNQFRAWLIYELNKRGANLEPQPKYADLYEAVDRLLFRGERAA